MPLINSWLHTGKNVFWRTFLECCLVYCFMSLYDSGCGYMCFLFSVFQYSSKHVFLFWKYLWKLFCGNNNNNELVFVFVTVTKSGSRNTAHQHGGGNTFQYKEFFTLLLNPCIVFPIFWFLSKTTKIKIIIFFLLLKIDFMILMLA